MKELSIEEKAKRYDEAVERAKNFIENGDERERTVAESIFAGIMEESEDERIRKTLIHIVKGACDKYGIKYRGKEISEEKLLAWLEKQGNQKPIDNDIKEALRTEYEKGRADAIVEMQNAWSEEDEDMLRIAIFMARARFNFSVEKWLESLKNRYTWRPSEEQIAALTDAVNYWNKSGCYSSDLVQLLTDLKKLQR